MNKAISFLLSFAVCASSLAYEKEVTVSNSKAGITLAGTLAMPDNATPRAMLVLASGSGAQNRDEEVFGLKPFKVLSDALVAQGYGVLRMDDRGVGASEGSSETALLDDLTDDAIYGVEFMRELFPGVKTGILGHSQGGLVAIKAATRSVPDFIVTLASPAWKGDSLVMWQSQTLSVAATGKWDAEKLERRLLDIAQSDMPDYMARPLLFMEVAATAGEAAQLPQVKEQITAMVSPMLIPVYRDLLRYNPTPDIRNINIPWLAINGEKDMQVPVESLEVLRQLNPEIITVVVPGHNHLLQKAQSGLPAEYATAGQSPSAESLSLLLDNLNIILK